MPPLSTAFLYGALTIADLLRGDYREAEPSTPASPQCPYPNLGGITHLLWTTKGSFLRYLSWRVVCFCQRVNTFWGGCFFSLCDHSGWNIGDIGTVCWEILVYRPVHRMWSQSDLTSDVLNLCDDVVCGRRFSLPCMVCCGKFQESPRVTGPFPRPPTLGRDSVSLCPLCPPALAVTCTFLHCRETELTLFSVLKGGETLPFCKLYKWTWRFNLAHSTQTIPVSQRVSKGILWCYSVVEVVRRHSLKHFSRFEDSNFSPHEHEPPEWHSSLVWYAGMAGIFQYLL